MKLIKIHSDYYLLSNEDCNDTDYYVSKKNTICQWSKTSSYWTNGYGMKIIATDSNLSEGLLRLDEKKIIKLIEDNLADRKFSLADIEECFNNAKQPLKFGSFNEYKEYLFWDEKRKTEWDVEVEMEVVPDLESRSRDNDGQICNGLKKLVPLVNEQGFVNIIKIIK